MRFRRFEVDGDSMAPTLLSGDYLMGTSATPVTAGDLVALEHPTRPGFWVVKRVTALGPAVIDLDAGTIDGRPIADPFRDELIDAGRFEAPAGTIFVLSDNRAATRADSRTFGPVRAAGSYRIALRYWPPRRFARL